VSVAQGRLKATVMDADQIRRSLSRIAHEIVERNRGVEDVVLVGVVSKGDVLAQRLAATLTVLEGRDVPFGRLDVTKHRDDLHLRPPDGHRPSSDIPEIGGKVVVLIDDVIHHGRTARAAMDALMDSGGRARSSSPCSSTAATASYRFGPTTWARTFPPPTQSASRS